MQLNAKKAKANKKKEQNDERIKKQDDE